MMRTMLWMTKLMQTNCWALLAGGDLLLKIINFWWYPRLIWQWFKCIARQQQTFDSQIKELSPINNLRLLCLLSSLKVRLMTNKRLCFAVVELLLVHCWHYQPKWLASMMVDITRNQFTALLCCLQQLCSSIDWEWQLELFTV